MSSILGREVKVRKAGVGVQRAESWGQGSGFRIRKPFGLGLFLLNPEP
jgi:hypothetical protein